MFYSYGICIVFGSSSGFHFWSASLSLFAWIIYLEISAFLINMIQMRIYSIIIVILVDKDGYASNFSYKSTTHEMVVVNRALSNTEHLENTCIF